jgi:pimeloyl-ACP methyl ester carboxylesterase
MPRPGERGRGTLLLIHGFPLNARMWELQLAAMAERGWHVIAPHLRGFGETSHAEPAEIRFTGQFERHLAESVDTRNTAASADSAWKSDDGAWDVGVDDYAGDVIDLLDGLHVRDAVVGGLSMGGYVAFALMRLAANYVRGLVLADTRSTADTPEGVEGRKRTAELARREGVDAVVEQMLPKLLGETTRRDRPEVGALVRSMARENSVDATVGAIAAMMRRPDSTPLLASIHVPTLVIVGEEDTLTPPAASEDLKRAISGSEVVVIPAAGHLSSLENPESFNAALARFLDHRV